MTCYGSSLLDSLASNLLHGVEGRTLHNEEDTEIKGDLLYTQAIPR
jgi:hypothetical protein